MCLSTTGCGLHGRVVVVAEPRPRRKKQGPWGLIAVIVVVVAIAAFLVYSAIGKKSTATRYVTQAVTKGTLTVAVAGNGNVVSSNSSAVDPGVSGIVTQLNVSLGSKVKKGDVLFVIDNPDLDASVVQARGSYQQAQSSLAKAKQTKTQARQQKTSSVAQAKVSYLQAQASAAKAKQSLNQAKSASPVDPLSVEAAQDSYDAALVAEKSAKTAYHQAEDNAEQNYSASVKAYNASVSSRESSRLSYENAIATADMRTVTAPITGYITTLSIRNGDQLGSTGSSSRTSGATTTSSSSGSTPIVISDLSELEAQVQISETDRPKIKTGQKVELTFDAVPDLTITGKVAEIDAVGTASQNVVTYGVMVTMDVQDKKLSPGMTASASIVTRVDTDVLLVPNAAVKTDSSGASYVQVLDAPNGTPRDVTVEVGPAGDTQTEITSGLNGNENVVVQTISSGTTSAASSRTGLGVLGGGGRAIGGGGGFRPGQ
jgi:RND family efflux transporter MFP subunit